MKTERDDFDEEIRRIAYTTDQIVSESSIEGSEHIKFKLKQLQTKLDRIEERFVFEEISKDQYDKFRSKLEQEKNQIEVSSQS